ncbi:MAG: UDP-N-acetylglucosamine 2-epimerase (non-hydrolyzing) [Pseudomonadota bacterium]
MTHRVDCIVGARPNFMKIAPIMKAFAASGGFETRLIHTGQHYDVEMNAVFFDELQIPNPDLNLEIGSGTHTQQTANVMMGLEQAFEANRPDLAVVVGDVNSTLAAALVAAKLQIPLAHVEAGLRSFDRAMPEEINRLITDRVSDLLLTTEHAAIDQLVSEGVARDAVHFVGNVMIDTLLGSLDRARPASVTIASHDKDGAFALAAEQGFGFVTLHRPSNVDRPLQLAALLEALNHISQDLPLVFALHPRTRARFDAERLWDRFDGAEILLTSPLSYLEMIGVMRDAKLAITDSGGVQEETTALGVPCLTVRDNTERPITISEGTNTLVGSSSEALKDAAARVLAGHSKAGRIPELWDGHAAERIVRIVDQYLKAAREHAAA